MNADKHELGRQAKAAGRNAQQTAKKVADKGAIPLVERLARLGYAAVGVVYLTLGGLALQAAWGVGSANVDQQTVLLKVLTQPFGRLLLAVLALGLVGYALWRLIQAVLDPEDEGKKSGAVIKRIGYAISGLSYLVLAYAAFRLDMGLGGSSKNLRDVTAGIMAKPWGRWLVGLIGLVMLGVGVARFVAAYKGKLERNFKSGKLDAAQKRWAIRLGRAGYVARGVVYSLIGVFLLQAAWQYNPQKAGGLGDALAALAKPPFGPIWLGAVGAGLVAYGVYALMLAQFRRLQLRAWE